MIPMSLIKTRYQDSRFHNCSKKMRKLLPHRTILGVQPREEGRTGELVEEEKQEQLLKKVACWLAVDGLL